MIGIVVAATASPTTGIPLWVTVFGLILASLVVPTFQYLAKRQEGRAGRGVAEATVNQIESTVVDSVVARLSAENNRLYSRLDDLGSQLTGLQDELGKHPTKIDLIDQIGRLQAQLVTEGVTPVNGPIKPDA